MAVTAGVVGNLDLFATGTPQHMSTQRRAAALFDRRHDLQLSQTQLYGPSPQGPMRAEDVRDFGHGCVPCSAVVLKFLQRTDHLAQQVGGDLRIECCRLQLLVPQQDLDHADVDLLLQQVGRKAVT
ncbi:hypothetical protein B0G71_6844 [Paraburkholderia sp. BL27I4N3]|nr:hypothetical protein B0G71_6844 [Paraburkholderia sp. BL27I4N3]